MTGEGGYLEDQKRMSFQRVTLESSLYYAATWLELSLLDPSSQGTRMTPFFFLDPSVKHWDDRKRALG
ncbi:hypothetical protein [Wolbachia endosymbiont (group A) of Agelastica alni]|uniref:hypothetical protein n=1 Tax=Wolbachia endosymbiont (group A) of Agelastica alni TaxID=3066130 RepID=UPI00397BAB6B